MKVKVHIKYPSIMTIETDREIEIPDGEDHENYIYEHREEIIESEGCEFCGSELSSALDLGYADVTLIKLKEDK